MTVAAVAEVVARIAATVLGGEVLYRLIWRGPLRRSAGR